MQALLEAGASTSAVAADNVSAVFMGVVTGKCGQAPLEGGTIRWPNSCATHQHNPGLRHEADLQHNVLSPGNDTPDAHCAAAGADDVVQLLLSAGADPSSPAAGGATPLHGAAGTGSLPLVLQLLQVCLTKP